MVPSNWQRQQTDKACGVLREDHRVSIHPDLINVGPDVVGVIAFAEGVSSDSCNVVVLKEHNRCYMLK